MLRIEYLGHGTTIVELGGVRVITDPLLRRWISGLVHRQPQVLDVADRGYEAVLISHLHHDHLDLRSLEMLGHATRIVVPRHGRAMVARRGFRNVLEVQPGNDFTIRAVHVRVTRAVHWGLRAPLGPWGGTVGFVLETPTERVYFAGDTQAFREMDTLGRIDLMLIPIAGWGPVLGPGHMGPRAAVDALRLVRPRAAIPIHWGSLVPFGLHLREWSYLTRPPVDFVELARREVPEVQVHVLQAGESWSASQP
jgi:L-ascorbate metabolism protein UlaG (beta-lactamase superfamily)